MLSDKLNKDNGQSLFFKAIVVVLILRLLLSVWLPMTGDEAYFILWGKNVDYGFYDHPPIAGLLLGAFLLISDAAWWLRLPATLLPIIISYFIYRLLISRHPQVAAWVALVFLVAPVNIINVLITTDTPLMFFSFISAVFFYRAVSETEKNKDYFFAGLFLGLAFFSKYFAVFLGVSYGIYILLFLRNRKGMIGLSIIFSMVVVFAALNVIWNYNHCWNNILFNLVNRTAATDEPLMSFLKYVAVIVYLFSPVLIYYLIKNRNELKNEYSNKFTRVFIWLSILPIFLFLIIVIRKEVGLHWLFSFYPFVFIAFAGVLNVKQWKGVFHFMWIFSVLHVAALSSILTLPVEMFSDKKEATQNITFGKYPQEVLSNLKAYENDYTLATISYGFSSIVSYHARKHYIVFGQGSFHAREDDRLTNFKNLNGKNILIFKRTKGSLEGLKKFFSSTERVTFLVRGVSFEILLGKGFNYSLYYKDVLEYVDKSFYSMPSWLPVGQCEFKDKYGFK